MECSQHLHRRIVPPYKLDYTDSRALSSEESEVPPCLLSTTSSTVHCVKWNLYPTIGPRESQRERDTMSSPRAARPTHVTTLDQREEQEQHENSPRHRKTSQRIAENNSPRRPLSPQQLHIQAHLEGPEEEPSVTAITYSRWKNDDDEAAADAPTFDAIAPPVPKQTHTSGSQTSDSQVDEARRQELLLASSRCGLESDATTYSVTTSQQTSNETSSLPPAIAALAAIKRAERLLHRDPPSGNTDRPPRDNESRHSDPPLSPSLSKEEKRRDSRPERNPNKQRTFLKPKPENTVKSPRTSDPEVVDTVIHHDSSGELNPRTVRVADEKDTDQQQRRDHAIRPMPESPRKSAKVKEPLSKQIQPFQEEKKDDIAEARASKPQRSCQLALRRLWELCEKSDDFENDNETEFTFRNFTKLINLSFPYFNNKEPSVGDLAHLQIQTRRKHVPVALTTAFLQTMASLKASSLVDQSSTTQRTALSAHEERDSWINRIADAMEARQRREVMIISTMAGSRDEEAVEIDLNGGFSFAAKDYGGIDPGDDDGKWWEVAAKLGHLASKSQTSQDLGFPRNKRDSSAGDPPETTGSSDKQELPVCTETKAVKGHPSIEESIKEHWKDRDGTKKQQGEEKPKQLPYSFSSTENQNSFETSLCSTFSSMKTFDLDSEEFWLNRRDMAIWPKRAGASKWLPTNTMSDLPEPMPIDAVSTAVNFRRPSFMVRRRGPGTSQWRQKYQPRTRSHPGFYDIDVNSLYVSTAVTGYPHYLDLQPWEHREVKQRFLHEQSVSYNRNWFGKTRKVYGNDKKQQPVCRPKSMEMPMRAGEWTEEWYTKPWDDLYAAPSLDSTDADLKEIQQIRRRYKIGDEFDENGDELEDMNSWEETPECGTFKNVKLRIGEHVTRLTPDYTSSLRRSRWRKKYFPRGTFPY